MSVALLLIMLCGMAHAEPEPNLHSARVGQALWGVGLGTVLLSTPAFVGADALRDPDGVAERPVIADALEWTGTGLALGGASLTVIGPAMAAVEVDPAPACAGIGLVGLAGLYPTAIATRTGRPPEFRGFYYAGFGTLTFFGGLCQFIRNDQRIPDRRRVRGGPLARAVLLPTGSGAVLSGQF